MAGRSVHRQAAVLRVIGDWITEHAEVAAVRLRGPMTCLVKGDLSLEDQLEVRRMIKSWHCRARSPTPPSNTDSSTR